MKTKSLLKAGLGTEYFLNDGRFAQANEVILLITMKYLQLLYYYIDEKVVVSACSSSINTPELFF